MSFRILDDDNISKHPEKKLSFLGKQAENIKHAIKETPRTTASSAATVASVGLGLPGDILGFFNDLVAAPISSAITGKPGIKYEETPLGKTFATSRDIEEDIHRILPYTKPKNDYEKGANEIIGTASALMMPGAQARVGRFIGTSPVTRAFFKSIGSYFVGETAKNLSGDEKKGQTAKAGALFAMSLFDRQGVGRFISTIYNRARDALDFARNPNVNAVRFRERFQATQHRLSTGTLAPSEAAVVQDIERSLAHVQGDQIPVENLWGISRSLNERRMEAMRNAPSRSERVRARRFYDGLIHDVNEELTAYGRTNPEFGIPFQEAQEGFSTLARSNTAETWIKENIAYNPVTGGLLHLFGGGLGAALVKGGALTAQSGIMPLAAYQTGKLMYRIYRSPVLRRYYTAALSAATQENVQTFNRTIKKMDENLQKENKKDNQFKLLD